ncbi:hypothetical protein PENTCL1PPCAC_14560 [Pristionchus entomophagus]|uniref:Uncharacterized protein n=1 Tax=Pristionchus entomophagus TaxID=358040 RepID=A0AAV5TG15_9BILA|nr:hypothetical protein PENTCL1PPCAC_14560 [Pristionchus entomophagus]
MDGGSTMMMPNLVRLQTVDEVYRMYLMYLEEEGLAEKALKETQAKYIINLVAPTRRKNLTCVDEKIADGVKAFDELYEIVQELLKAGLITKDTATSLIKSLQSGRAYLRGDFKVHIKKLSSPCADHCATFALSDPNQPEYATECSHKHTIVCESCAKLDTTLALMKKLLNDAVHSAPTPKEKILFWIRKEECDIDVEAIYEMKRHQIRASLSHMDKMKFMSRLKPGRAVIGCRSILLSIPTRLRRSTSPRLESAITSVMPRVSQLMESQCHIPQFTSLNLERGRMLSERESNACSDQSEMWSDNRRIFIF